LERIGEVVTGATILVLDLLALLVNSCSLAPWYRRGQALFFYRSVVEQVYFTAVQGWLLIFLVGGVLGVLAALPLLSFGVTDIEFIATVMKVVLFHEVNPFLIVLIMIGRSGTAITAQIGEMQCNQAVDSLIAMDIEPHRFLVLPRVIGMTLSLLFLVFWGDIGSVFGAGLFLLLAENISLHSFVLVSIHKFALTDLAMTAAMIGFYGAIVVAIHSHFGFISHTRNDIARNLPRAFVSSLVACILITLVFSLVRNG
jgi:phospholipid/cholesterol/gamma-HCH transport system permease protein